LKKQNRVDEAIEQLQKGLAANPYNSSLERHLTYLSEDENEEIDNLDSDEEPLSEEALQI